MNILHINFSDWFGNGGTAIAMRRIHHELNQTGRHRSRILALARTTEEQGTVATIKRTSMIKAVERAGRNVLQRFNMDDINAISTFWIGDDPAFQQADVIHMHCIHEGFFNYLALPVLTKAKPTIFTFHDMWAFTGQCHYSYDCTRWQTGCGSCPYPRQGAWIDGSHLEWKLKQWAFQHSNISVTCPSEWMADLARQSMFQSHSIDHVSNGLDTDVFRPLDMAACRAKLHIPADRYVLLFAAANVADRRKGVDLLLDVLRTLPQELHDKLFLLVMGNAHVSIGEELGLPYCQLGYISDEQEMAEVYSAADVFLFPTRADNQPLVIQESLGCGTPVISFAVGGVKEMIRPGETGFLAASEDVAGFREALVMLLTDDVLRSTMREHARAQALAEFDVRSVVKSFEQVYHQAIRRHDMTAPLKASAP